MKIIIRDVRIMKAHKILNKIENLRFIITCIANITNPHITDFYEMCSTYQGPLQFDIADRVILQMSNPGDVVLDPFGGLMTVPYRAISLGRIGWGVELSP